MASGPYTIRINYIRQRIWTNVMYSPLFVRLLLCEISDFRKVYWSPRSVCLCVCLFVTLRNLRFSQSILVTAVCLFVSLFVCLSVCRFAMYRPHRWSDHPEILIDDVFWTKDHGQFFWKSDKRQGQGHHFCVNQIMGHNFWTGSGRDF